MWGLFPERALFQKLPYNGHILSVSPDTERIVQMINFLNLSFSLLSHPVSVVLSYSGNKISLDTIGQLKTVR